jgi:acyl-CoA synthetase (AMP-forming)/AMP-acid ligase II
VTRPDVALISPFPALGERHGGWTGVASYSANLAGALTDAGARVTVLAIRRFCSARLASYKIPRRIIFLDQLPITARGKVDRAALDALVRNQLAL